MLIVLECSHGQFHFDPDEDKLMVVGCEEDWDGADKIQFVCPVCGDHHWSRVYGR